MTAAEQGYLGFLCERDGAANFARHTLSRREAFFERLEREPVRSSRPIDAGVFARNLARRRPEPGLDDRMLWLLATAKANQAERFGVGLGELYGKLDASDPVRVHIALQEVYHTRILADVVAMFGVVVTPKPPSLVVRSFVRLLLALPEARQLPLTAMAEMSGCVLFRALRDRGVVLFAGEPAVAARIRLLYDEILADEIGHVGYVASRLGPAGRAVARTLHRVFGARLAGSMPEVARLFGRAELRRRFAAPFRTDEQVRELCGLAYAVAAI